MRSIRIDSGPTPITRSAGRSRAIPSTLRSTGPCSGASITASQTETEVIVSPEDDVEIRRITLINRSLRTRRLDLTSYVELVAGAAQRRPAASGLQQAVHPDRGGARSSKRFLAYRRPRSEDDPPIYVAHRFTLEAGLTGRRALQFETDRRRFIGRGRTLANPMGVFQELGNSQGFVLDPILSLRQSVTLGPGQRVQVSLVLAAGETREQVLEADGQVRRSPCDRSGDGFRLGSAQLELRLLRIQPDEARRFQQLASHLLFPNPLLRSSAERIEENRKGQAGLWAYGISGDLPIALVAIGEDAGYQPGPSDAPGAYLLAHARVDRRPGDPERGGGRL